MTLRLLILIALMIGGWSRPAEASPPSAMQFTRAELAQPTQGGYGQPPTQLAPDTVPTRWRSVTLPHVSPPGARAGHDANYVVSNWYRVYTRQQPSSQSTYLYIPRWQSTGKVAIYADGKLVYAPRSGPNWNSFNIPVWVKLAAAGDTPPREILVNINSREANGSRLSTLWVGDEAALLPGYQMRKFIQVDAPKFCATFLLMIGAVTALIWFRKRNEPTYLLIFAVAVMEYIHSYEYFVDDAPTPIPDVILQWMAINSKAWYLTFSFLMINHFLHVDFKKSKRIMLVFSVIYSIITFGLMLRNLPSGQMLPNIWLPPVMQVIIISIFGWIAWRRRPSWEGFLLCLFISILVPAGLHDLAKSKFLINGEGVFLLPLVAVLQVGMFLYLIISRHLRSLTEAEQAQSNLAIRLGEREAELAIINQRLRESDRRETLESERQRLMRDMHDGIGSTLMGALVAVEHGKLDDAEVVQLLRSCIDDLKLVIDSLEPGDNDLLLLLATVRYRLEPRFEQAGIALSWDVSTTKNLPPLPPEAALHVLRMVQEIFTNIIKHAKADQVRVAITSGEGHVQVMIEDNGTGFTVADQEDAKPSAVKSRGLANLNARAAAVGGSISWTSEPGVTRFQLKLPTPHSTSLTK
jgi:signal transduction histidine kinase